MTFKYTYGSAIICDIHGAIYSELFQNSGS